MLGDHMHNYRYIIYTYLDRERDADRLFLSPYTSLYLIVFFTISLISRLPGYPWLEVDAILGSVPNKQPKSWSRPRALQDLGACPSTFGRYDIG